MSSYQLVVSFFQVTLPVHMNIQAMRPHELSRLVMSVLREQRVLERSSSGGSVNYGLWKAIAVRTRGLVSEFGPSDLSTVVFGLGKSRIRDKELLTKAASEIFIPNLNTMTLNDISHVLSGFARVDVRNDILFDLASREIARKIHSNGSLADIASIFSSFARLNYTHPLLFEVLGKRAALVAPQTNSSGMELSQIIHSLAILGHKSDQRLLAIMASEICRKIDSMPVYAIARVIDGYRKLGIRNQFLIEVSLDECFKRRHEFDPKSTSILMNAIGRLNCPKTQLIMEYFVSDLARRGMAKFDIPAIALTANGIANHWTNREQDDADLQTNIQKVFNLMGDRVSAIAGELTPRSIAIIVKAFGAVQARHGPLLYNIPKHVRSCIEEMSIPEIGMIMKGYAQLGIRNDDLLDCVPSRLVSLLESSSSKPPESESTSTQDHVFALTVRDHADQSGQSTRNVRGMVDTLEAYAILMIGDGSVTRKLIREIDRNRHQLSITDTLLVIPKCLNTLCIRPPESLQHQIEEAANASGVLITPGVLEELNALRMNKHLVLE